jgi:hypothetical protein
VQVLDLVRRRQLRLGQRRPRRVEALSRVRPLELKEETRSLADDLRLQRVEARGTLRLVRHQRILDLRRTEQTCQQPRTRLSQLRAVRRSQSARHRPCTWYTSLVVQVQ